MLNNSRVAILEGRGQGGDELYPCCSLLGELAGLQYLPHRMTEMTENATGLFLGGANSSDGILAVVLT